MRPAPSMLGRYELRGKIADGGMASVYAGKSPEHPELVALKVIKPHFASERDFVDMFLDEARLAAQLDHPNIVRVHEHGKVEDRLYLAMELLRGQSLWAVWQACRGRQVRVRYDLLAWIGARVAEALHYAHELPLHVVHRDVNASNIFVGYDGRIKVIDFGLAKADQRISRTAAGVVKGKLAYMSPEQTVGAPLDRRTDVFALAATLWEISVDRRLFKGADDVATLKAVNAARVPDPQRLIEGYPPGLWRILRRALAREREARFATAQDMGIELQRFAEQEAAGAGREAVARMMDCLFRAERQRDDSWLESVESGVEAPPRDSLTVRPSLDALPPGLFLPAPVELPGAAAAAAAPAAAPAATPTEVRAPAHMWRALAGILGLVLIAVLAAAVSAAASWH